MKCKTQIEHFFYTSKCTVVLRKTLAKWNYELNSLPRSHRTSFLLDRTTDRQTIQTMIFEPLVGGRYFIESE